MSGKGGTQKQKVKIPDALKAGSKQALSLVDQIGEIGYVPYRGPDVAAFTPQQEAAFNGARAASDAFGLSGSAFAHGAGLPTVTTSPGGVRAYSSAPMYDAAIAQIDPAQLEAILSAFSRSQPGKKNKLPPVAAAAPAGATPRPIGLNPWWVQ